MRSASRCPLCDDDLATEVGQVDYAAVWTSLRDRWGATFSEPTRTANTPAGGQARIVRCTTCGLDHADPVLPGDHRFYEEFDASGYYEDDRWEFDVVASTIGPNDDVIDVGCGRGAFLGRLPAGAGRRLGLDHNERAIATLAAAGLEGRSDDLADLAAAGVQADVVTAFHVIEHLAHVDQLVEPALAVLRPGGRLILSVPNRRRLSLEDFEVLDGPPHHVSRWAAEQLRFLAARHRLGIRSLQVQPLPPHTSAHLATHVAGRLARRSTDWATEPARWRDLVARSRLGFSLLADLRPGAVD